MLKYDFISVEKGYKARYLYCDKWQVFGQSLDFVCKTKAYVPSPKIVLELPRIWGEPVITLACTVHDGIGQNEVLIHF